MLNSPALEVAIGLTFCFASIALMASVAKEAISSLMGLRARTLWDGIGQLINDPQFKGLGLKLFNHGLVNPSGQGTATALPKTRFGSQLPSYVDAKAFSQAVLDLIHEGEANWQALGQSIDKLQAATDEGGNAQLHQWLSGMYKRADAMLTEDRQKLVALQQGIADWFDAGMDRLSGAYKRHAQRITFCVGLLMAGVLNIDAIHLASELWRQPTTIAAVSSAAMKMQASDATRENTAKQLQSQIDTLAQLPVGRDWREVCKKEGLRALLINLLGVLITASAAMFGAPFWFDMLQKLVQLRSTGPRPGEDKKPAVQKP